MHVVEHRLAKQDNPKSSLIHSWDTISL